MADEIAESLNRLKRHVFYELIETGGRAMIVVRYSPEVILGKRGFTEEEKNAGLLLTLNSSMKFVWDDYGLSATLSFGPTVSKCYIPAANIENVYSPELNTQFFSAYLSREKEAAPEGKISGSSRNGRQRRRPADAEPKDNIISVDFVHKKLLDRE